MTEAIVTRIPNRPGEVGKLTQMLGQANVNISALAVTAHGDQGIAYLICDNTKNAQEALRKGGVEVETHPVLSKRLPNKPGALAEFTAQLGKEGVNITELIGVVPQNANEAEVFFDVENPEKAQRFFS